MVARSSSSVTPSGTEIASKASVSPMLQLAELVHDRLGDRGRKRFDVQLARELLEDAAFLDAGSVVDAGEFERHDRVDRLVQAHPQQVDVGGLAAHRVALGLLEHDRGGLGAVDAEVDHGARAGKRDSQFARVDAEADGVDAAAVEHAGDAPGAAQAPCGARAVGVATCDFELCGCGSHEEVEDFSNPWIQQFPSFGIGLLSASSETDIPVRKLPVRLTLSALDDRQAPEHDPRHACVPGGAGERVGGGGGERDDLDRAACAADGWRST